MHPEERVALLRTEAVPPDAKEIPMMRGRAFFVVTLAAGMAGCSSSTGHSSPGGDAGSDARFNPDTSVGGDDSGSTLDAGDDAATDAATDAPAAQTFVRLADWSPDFVPFDFCAAPHGTGRWVGPLLAISAALDPDAGFAGDAGAHGLTFPGVTAYLGLTPGPYDVRLVAAQATDCSVNITSDATDLPALAVDAHTTVLVVGDATKTGNDATLTIIAIVDDVTPPAAGGLGLRFVNAAPSLPSVAFGTGSLATSSFVPLVTGVAFGTVGTTTAGDGGAIDANGYLTIPSLVGQASAAATGAKADATTASGLALGAGQTVTMAVIGGKTNGPPAELIECFDSRPPMGLLSYCRLAGP